MINNEKCKQSSFVLDTQQTRTMPLSTSFFEEKAVPLFIGHTTSLSTSGK